MMQIVIVIDFPSLEGTCVIWISKVYESRQPGTEHHISSVFMSRKALEVMRPNRMTNGSQEQDVNEYKDAHLPVIIPVILALSIR